MATTEMAKATIRDLKENHSEYYESLHPKCKVCKNILSSYECELCRDYDMFVRVEGDYE